MLFPFYFSVSEKENLDDHLGFFNKYRVEDNECLCDRKEADDFCLSANDILGVPVRFYLCNRCSVIRPGKRLSHNSLEKFYNEDYVGNYIQNDKMDDDRFFRLTNSESRAIRFYNIAKKFCHQDISHVFEIGCGVGQNLWPFFKDGKNVSGCDYGEEYLEFGRKKGLSSLYAGEIDLSRTRPSSQDLLILSHVVEHVPNPLEFIEDGVEVVREGGYILIEVPGVLNGRKSTLQTTFQLPHLHTYNKGTMVEIIKKVGLEIICIDEEVTVLARKPSGWEKKGLRSISSNAKINNNRIKRNLGRRYILMRFRKNVKSVLRRFSNNN